MLDEMKTRMKSELGWNEALSLKMIVSVALGANSLGSDDFYFFCNKNYNFLKNLILTGWFVV